MDSIGKEFTQYQLRIIQSLSFFTVSRMTVESGDGDKYNLRNVGYTKTFFYFLFIVNTIVKFLYLLLLVNGFFGPVDFLDKMCALLWILICVEITQEIFYWAYKYPFFEVLINLWRVENVIFAKIGKPKAIKEKCDLLFSHSISFHMFILTVGCIMIGFQFVWSPKYSVYTYAAFEEDNPLLLILFTCHEVIFMWQGWTMYLSIVIVSSSNAIELTGILQGMTNVMRSLKETPGSNTGLKNNTSYFMDPTVIESVDSNETILDPSPTKNAHKSTQKTLRNSTRVRVNQTHKYNSCEELVNDYKQLMLITGLLNDWSSYRIVGVHTIGYCQFISDVFMLMQLIRLPEMDLPAVLWFGEDALICILMMFRMFTLMSRVSVASTDFLWATKDQMIYEAPIRRKTSRRLIRALNLVSLKLGPCHLTPGTVGTAVMMLMNYYIVVAMWKAV